MKEKIFKKGFKKRAWAMLIALTLVLSSFPCSSTVAASERRSWPCGTLTISSNIPNVERTGVDPFCTLRWAGNTVEIKRVDGKIEVWVRDGQFWGYGAGYQVRSVEEEGLLCIDGAYYIAICVTGSDKSRDHAGDISDGICRYCGFNNHIHTWSYSADGATLTAKSTCHANSSCEYNASGEKTATLTISATPQNYSGISGLSEFNTATGNTIAESNVEIYKVDAADRTTGGTKVTGTPSEDGYYYAALTVEGQKAVKAFTIGTPGGSTTYTVHFNANGGTGTMADVTGVSTGYTVPTCTFTAPAGKVFDGWATSANGTKITTTAIDVTAETTLYAVWKVDTSSWPADKNHEGCEHTDAVHFYATGSTYSYNGNNAYEGRAIYSSSEYHDYYTGYGSGSYGDSMFADSVSKGWYWWDSSTGKMKRCSPAHAHTDHYGVTTTNTTNDTLSWYCGEDGCGSTATSTNPVKLTLTASSANYSDRAVTANYGDGEAVAWKTAVGSEAPTITYEKKSTDSTWSALTSAPSEVGEYRAVAKVIKDSTDYTAYKEFTISKAEISSVAFKEPTVAAAGTPATEAGLSIDSAANYTGAISWAPAGTTFGYNKTYTATVTLTAKDNYKFADAVTVPTGWTKETSSTDTSLVLTKTYDATAKAKITSITAPSVTTQLTAFTTQAAQLAALPTSVIVAVEDESVTSMAITWVLKDSTTYSTASEAENTFVWTITASEYANFDTNSKTLTGEVTLKNPNHTHSWSWKFDKTSHWQECECGAKQNQADHSYVNGKCICGSKKAKPVAVHSDVKEEHSAPETVRAVEEMFLPLKIVEQDKTGVNREHFGIVPDKTYNLTAYVTIQGFVSAINKIEKANPKANTVSIYTGKPFTFNKRIVETIQKGGKTIIYYFYHKGHLYSVTVPATVDASKVLEKAGFAGPLYVGKMLGTTKLVK